MKGLVVVLVLLGLALLGLAKPDERINGKFVPPKLEEITEVMARVDCFDGASTNCLTYDSRFTREGIAFWTTGKDANMEARVTVHKFNNLAQLLIEKNFFNTHNSNNITEKGTSVEIGAIWKSEGQDFVHVVRVNDGSLDAMKEAVHELSEDLEWTAIPEPYSIATITREIRRCEDKKDCRIEKLELHQNWALFENDETSGAANFSFPTGKFVDLTYKLISHGFFILPKEVGTPKEGSLRLMIRVDYYPTSDSTKLERKTVACYGKESVLPELEKISANIDETSKSFAGEISLMNKINLIGITMSLITLAILIMSVVVAILVLRKRRNAATDYNLLDGKSQDSTAPALVFKKDRPTIV